uniref:RNA helicase n=1 Tax=Hirondellea gigas TaxID=1518452 RepID=A0A2P2I5R0_9CRUS
MAATFREMGIIQELCDACERVGWKTPTEIQQKAIPLALEGRDVIGLAETGSGKTAAYILPMLQRLYANPVKYFGLVITPTRELAFQVKEHIEALGTKVGVQVAVLTGGMDKKAEKLKLNAKPHIIVATPGRLLDHLKTTKGFHLEKIKFLVFDEADRILGVDLEEHMNDILRVLPKDRRTMLFSATMTMGAQKLERASLVDPVRVNVNKVCRTVETLEQHMTFVPEKEKMANLVWILLEFEANKNKNMAVIIFCATQLQVLKVHISLMQLTFSSVPLYGKMEQNKRLAALHKFKRKARNILVATDVASRGLDIPGVDCVINFDLPICTKDYIHRVGRTARAGRKGKSITFSTEDNVKDFLLLEKRLKVKMKHFEIVDSEVDILVPSVDRALATAQQEIEKMEEHHNSGSKGRGKKRPAPFTAQPRQQDKKNKR